MVSCIDCCLGLLVLAQIVDHKKKTVLQVLLVDCMIVVQLELEQGPSMAEELDIDLAPVVAQVKVKVRELIRRILGPIEAELVQNYSLVQVLNMRMVDLVRCKKKIVHMMMMVQLARCMIVVVEVVVVDKMEPIQLMVVAVVVVVADCIVVCIGHRC
jgi:hypothetical protein